MWEPDVYLDVKVSDLIRQGSVTIDGKTDYVFSHKKYNRYYRTKNGYLYVTNKTGKLSCRTYLSKEEVNTLKYGISK